MFERNLIQPARAQLNTLLQIPDFFQFEAESDTFTKHYCAPQVHKAWQTFYRHLKQLSGSQSEKLILAQCALSTLQNPLLPSQFAQLLTLAWNLKAAYGILMFQTLFCAAVPPDQRRLEDYLSACQYLIDLQDVPNLHKEVKQILPHLEKVVVILRAKHVDDLAKKFPEKKLSETMDRFKVDSLVQFPLSDFELNYAEVKYQHIQKYVELKNLQAMSLSALKLKLAEVATTKDEDVPLLAIMTEILRHFFKIKLYDTQLIALLALINTPEKLKGRLAQIKTGEGKSTIIAVLAALKACQGQFVDVITSSSYLAKRDAKKYALFYEALELSVGYIDELDPKQADFHPSILYGTNTAFEFAYLRDGLYGTQLRYSIRNGACIARPFEVVIVDEVDNLFLDTALNSALLSIPNPEQLTWIYPSILTFVQAQSDDTLLLTDALTSLKQYLMLQHPDKCDEITSFSQIRLKHWLQSAYQALHTKKERQDYVIDAMPSRQAAREKRSQIVIMDYANTGRRNEGSQWSKGLHQFVEAKHHLPITEESLTAASLAHPTYFTQYAHIFGLTGTMGETVEREEIQKIYQVDSFDVPPHFPSLRQPLPTVIAANKSEHHQSLLQSIHGVQKAKRPVLVLFETVDASETFSQFLHQHPCKHQLINENQKEDEDYLITRAGEERMLTIATNTAGRGTDILLTAGSKAAGGLHVIFAFYPDNIRVEQQGFGRAGRQGQPGSCVMILSLEDERVCALLGETLCKNIIANKTLGFDNVDQMMEQLNQARTHQTKKYSERRYQGAQLEALYFNKLQTFFNRLKAIHTTFSMPDCKEAWVSLYKTYTPNGKMEKALALSVYSEWKHIIDAIIVLKKSEQDFFADWSFVFEQFKKQYLSHVQYIWAKFYHQLHAEMDGSDITQAQAHLGKLYATTQPLLEKYSHSPRENILTCFQLILQTAHEPCLNTWVVQAEEEQKTKKANELEKSMLGNYFNRLFSPDENKPAVPSIHTMTNTLPVIKNG